MRTRAFIEACSATHSYKSERAQAQTKRKMSALLTLLTLTALLRASGTASTRSPEEADKCYDESGRAVRCVADFINAAFGELMTASSQCGSSAREQVCRVVRDRTGRAQRQCSQCDARVARLSHGARWLTDLHNPNNATCWISHKLQRNDENVTLELALGKKYEVTYVSVQLCSTRPDSVAIFKSADYGRSWTPFQFYSSQCRKLFNRSPRAIARSTNEQEALCTQFAAGDDAAASRISFSTLEGRPSAYAVDESPILQDWMTATNIRIVMLRLKPASDAGSSLTLPTTSPDSEHGPDAMVYAVADVAVGGRCKCNGHAAKCVRAASGKLVCDCRHNTMGDDCEKCRPLYQDRPWARGLIKSANECQQCNCNMHSKQCRFNKDLYLQSGKESGGVCLKCKHHTAGRHCHFCAEGYYRDWTKAMTHRKACRACECHPVGAADSLCNQTTGKCRCKEGVTGTACDRCMTGYQQTRSPSTPCVRMRVVTNNEAENTRPARQCGECEGSKKVNLAKYCDSDFAIKALVKAEETSGDWNKYTVDVLLVIKKDSTKMKKGNMDFWVRRSDSACDCPKMRVQKQYVIIGMENWHPYENGLIVDPSSVVVQWKDDWLQRLRGFYRDEMLRKCPEVEGTDTANKLLL